MSRSTPKVVVAHSSAWVIQVWLSFALSVGVTAIGIWHLPVDTWVKSFMAMGLLFSVGSAFSLSKTVRDQHEMEQLGARLDEARVAKMLSEHDPMAPPKL
ncbi:hypothetical protein LXT21_29640 [Myxococcus sp. K38C18041901]|uniref:YiaA/YiaB family inner membrane protein n=1 Tax=Myxococcus guangdongensis TaxID=2906760 RepID=UPI0020A7C5E6|nr:YiaA/YiaB family inner membrane protein [Myxococcus guangdongensis]MCP3062955.1 hypothetical protein [Myxococcus guangdongensis]